jgi:hypothetical protein
MMTLDEYGYDQYHSDDRIFIFKPIEGMERLSSTGMIDQRVLNGENRLHAIKEPATGLWYVKYDKGGVPPALKEKWTSFNTMKKQIAEYYRKRGVETVEVEDEPKNSFTG